MVSGEMVKEILKRAFFELIKKLKYGKKGLKYKKGEEMTDNVNLEFVVTYKEDSELAASLDRYLRYVLRLEKIDQNIKILLIEIVENLDIKALSQYLQKIKEVSVIKGILFFTG